MNQFIIKLSTETPGIVYYYSGKVHSGCFWSCNKDIKKAMKFDTEDEAEKIKIEISNGYMQHFQFIKVVNILEETK
jgi:hypothetical protein